MSKRSHPGLGLRIAVSPALPNGQRTAALSTQAGRAIPSFPVVISTRLHPIPSRTRKLSSSEPMVLHGKPCGRVGRCRDFFEGLCPPRSPVLARGRGFSFLCAFFPGESSRCQACSRLRGRPTPSATEIPCAGFPFHPALAWRSRMASSVNRNRPGPWETPERRFVLPG
jgi:hypothetical protein